MIRYGLKHKKYGILGVEISYNDESSSDNKDFFCCAIRYELSVYYDAPWMVEEKELVKDILSENYDIEWYNSSYEQPVNPYDRKDLEIVKFEIKEKQLKEK